MKTKLSIWLACLGVCILHNNCEESSAQGINESCYEVIVGESPVNSDATKQLQVDCPGGMKAMGAGWSVLDETGAILDGQATYFQPSFDASHWLTNAKNQSAFESEWKLRVRVICTCEEVFQNE